jgi:alkylated DNA repair dioxygenase AlkB
MDLFKSDHNLLPFDGDVENHGPILSQDEAARYFDVLLESIAWRNDETVMFGKRIVTARKVAWYGDHGFSYHYSGTSKQALPWTPELLELKAQVESQTGSAFNSCLLNLYHQGNEGMGWHSDDEKSIDPNTSIASLSLGVARKFSFKHKQTKETVSLILETGSLLVMKPPTQIHWHHSLPKSKKILSPRINLTFRSMLIH